LRAHELRRIWERILVDDRLAHVEDDGPTGSLRDPIAASWRRSLQAGVDPVAGLAPIVADAAEMRERWREHPLGSLVPLVSEELRMFAGDSRHLVVVGDASGLLMSVQGDKLLKARAARAMNFLEGARWAEAAAGTNAIGTALAADHAVQVFAGEHFNEGVHGWWCSAAPVHDPASGRILGVVNVTGPIETFHPSSLTPAIAAAAALERRLAEDLSRQDARLRRRYGAMATRNSDLLVSGDGRFLLGNRVSWRPGATALPENGGEILLLDGSAVVAEPLGLGEAYLVRRSDDRLRGAATRAAVGRAEERARELAEEQAGLRRVATLVAREPSTDRFFAAVAKEVARVVKVPLVGVVRYEGDGAATQLAGWSENGDPFLVEALSLLDSCGIVASVRQTGRPARVNDCKQSASPAADALRRAGFVSAVASPIIAEGRVWGAMVVSSTQPEPLPEGTEASLADFTELVATAIANAESRAELIASRARIVAAADETRRQIERDLHDGAQQQLVSLALALQSAVLTIPADLQDLRVRVTEVADGITDVLEELRQLTRGIHPANVLESGLGPALRVLVRRCPVRVKLETPSARRFPQPVEVAAYYVVSEALTNAAKHACASVVHVGLEVDDATVRLSIRDDGVGGADPARGSGLLGLKDRVQAIGGMLEVASPVGRGTSLRVTIPCVVASAT
jgi:signal transduction histidine kinase